MRTLLPVPAEDLTRPRSFACARAGGAALARWAPPEAAPGADETGEEQQSDARHNRAILRTGSKSFAAASRLLPRPLRAPTAAVYAFCRVADDAVDLDDDPRAALSLLRSRLDDIYRGAPGDDPVDRAFSQTVRQFGVPRAMPEALLEGFAWDSAGRSYETIEDTLDYAVRVASTVGLMMTLLMGRRERVVLARAGELGVAMQLTNIARDVGEDARLGRLYLPASWLREEGLDPASFLGEPRFSPAIGRVVARLLALADGLYARAETGIVALPERCQSAIMAARLIYADIGRVIAEQGFDAVNTRAHVSAARKLVLLMRARARVRTSSEPDPAEPLPQLAWLIDSVPQSS